MTAATESDDRALAVRTFSTRSEMGHTAARDVAEYLRDRLSNQSSVRMVFAAAPSQSEMLASLVRAGDIDWHRVTAFHMDEYIGLPATSDRRFSVWLDGHIFNHVPFGAVHRIDPGHDAMASAGAYAELLATAPIDLVCLGIGVNGHLAFNDPPVADFDDPLSVKIVELDAICRQQQVDDGCFDTIGQVPKTAITLTIPRLLDCARIFAVVPGTAKRDAVRRTLGDPITTDCPATILRTHPDCTLYLDNESDPNARD